MQGSFVTDGEIEKIIDFLKSGTRGRLRQRYHRQHRARSRALRRKEERPRRFGRGRSDEYDADDRDAILDSDDAMFDAIKVAVDANMISTSLLQRKLSLGYSRAARIVDKLEKLGITAV